MKRRAVTIAAGVSSLLAVAAVAPVALAAGPDNEGLCRAEDQTYVPCPYWDEVPTTVVVHDPLVIEAPATEAPVVIVGNGPRDRVTEAPVTDIGTPPVPPTPAAPRPAMTLPETR